jgi:hypothetical protein
MSLERIKETIKTKVENFQARREFYSMMPIGNERPFEVRVFGERSDDIEGDLLIIPGYNPSDRVFDEIKKRVEANSSVKIKVDFDGEEKTVSYRKM